ncbi:MAG: VWA domain-containing protein [Bacteroidia bacterium]|nr:VWA domain-containing protein [Bacteroidia bacterium]
MHEVSEQLQQEFDRFIEFGTVLDQTTRRYLVQYLRAKFNPHVSAPPQIDDTYFRYFSRALDRIFEETELLQLVHDKPRLSEQVTADTLFWIKKAYQRAREKNPFAEETERLSAATVMPFRDLVQRYRFLTNFLLETYERSEVDGDFYAAKFKQLIDGRSPADLSLQDQQQIERIMTDMLAQWDALLSAKLLDYQLRKLEEEEDSFKDVLNQKVKEYQKLFELISPFADYVGRYWDMSRELWKEGNFDLLEKYDELLANEDSVRELADLLGRMREAEIVTEEEIYERVIVRQMWEEPTEQKAEIVGVKESNDLEYLLSSEVALLGDPDTEMVFLKRFADHGLQTLRFEHRELVQSEHHFTETDLKTRRKDRGPFILCIDTSDSMNGTPEQIAKVLCFAILKLAARDNRRAFLINFSTGVQTIDLFDIGRSLDEIAAFLRMSFHGGTDITLALNEVLRQLQTESYRDADVLVISDFIMYKIDDDVLDRVRYHQQNNGTAFHTLTLHKDPNAEVIDQFDTNWTYDPADKGIIRELAGELRKLGGR